MTYDFFQDSWICGFVQFFGDDVVNFFRYGRRNARLFQIFVKWPVASEYGSGRNGRTKGRKTVGKENVFTNTRRLNNKTGLDWLLRLKLQLLNNRDMIPFL